MNTHKQAERVLLAFITLVYGVIRVLINIIASLIKHLAGESNSTGYLHNFQPMPFVDMTTLIKGDIVLFLNSDGEKVSRVYLGYMKITSTYWLYFFDTQDSEDVHLIKVGNPNAYDVYPEISWRVIGHKHGYAVNSFKRKKIGLLIKLHEVTAKQNSTPGINNI